MSLDLWWKDIEVAVLGTIAEYLNIDLQFDPQTICFIGNEEANARLILWPQKNAERMCSPAALHVLDTPSGSHAARGITHWGFCREGFQEATALEIAWFEEHLKGAAR